MMRFGVAGLMLLAAAQAQAQPLTPPATNMTTDYPRPVCVKPDKSTLPRSPGVGDQAAMSSYNLRVQTFNKKAGAFNACLAAYNANAKADIERIQAIVQAAVAEANSN